MKNSNIKQKIFILIITLVFVWSSKADELINPVEVENFINQMIEERRIVNEIMVNEIMDDLGDQMMIEEERIVSEIIDDLGDPGYWIILEKEKQKALKALEEELAQMLTESVLSSMKINRIRSQTLIINAKFPSAHIEEKWNDGYNITTMAFGDGRWVIVMSTGSGLGQQSFTTKSFLPEKFIKEQQKKGSHISVSCSTRWHQVNSPL